jgi:hypothetical protein
MWDTMQNDTSWKIAGNDGESIQTGMISTNVSDSIPWINTRPATALQILLLREPLLTPKRIASREMAPKPMASSTK